MSEADLLPDKHVVRRGRYPASILFEECFESSKYSERVFNLAVNGGLSSDQLMILLALLQSNKFPKTIIYGITPRDFVNNGLFCPASTPVFRFLDQCFDVGKQLPGVYENEHNVLFTYLSEHLWLLRQSLKIKNLAIVSLSKWLPSEIRVSNVLSHKLDLTEKIADPSELIRDKYRKFSTQFSRLSYLLNRRSSMVQNIKAYNLAYRPFSDFSYRKQLDYFKSVVQLCKKNSINLIVVNMPTTQENIQILGRENYQRYLHDIKEKVYMESCKFIDMNKLEKFSSGHFSESLHLNSVGAKIFIYELAKYLSHPESAVNNGQGLSFPNSECRLASEWLARAYFSKPVAPDVVLLGGSQLGPVWGSDALIYDETVDVTGNRCSKVLEQDLYALLNRQLRVFIGALPNLTIADQLVISQRLFSSKYRPSLVALSLSPLSFLDNSLSLSEPIAFYSKYKTTESLKKGLAENNSISVLFSPKIEKNFALKSTLTLGKPFIYISPGELTINSGDDYLYSNDTNQYKKIYVNFTGPKFAMQLNCLDSLLKFLADQHISVVAFNLPVSASNKKLLPESFWKEYEDRVSKTCWKYGADYVNVDKVVLPFEDKEFIDGVHLNLAGGHRLSKTIALFIANKFHTKTFQELLARDKYLK